MYRVLINGSRILCYSSDCTSVALKNSLNTRSRIACDFYLKRYASIFSFFRRGRQKVENSEASSTQGSSASEAQKLWIEALQSFEQKDLITSVQDKNTLGSLELRRLKKKAFLHAIEMYLQRYGKTKRNFNQFAVNALEQMPVYEVEEDLECYKAVLKLFPTGRMIVTNFLQAELGHFDRQQNIVINLLQQMAKHHVIPDDEVGQMIISIFGWRNRAMQHYRHMMYWIPKLYYANPWPVSGHIKDQLDMDPVLLARTVAERICPDRSTEFRLVKLANSEHELSCAESLISAQSEEQRALLTFCTKSSKKSDAPATIYLDGPNFVWYNTLQLAYYTLWTELDQDRLQHEKQHVERRQKRSDRMIPYEFPIADYVYNDSTCSLDEVPISLNQKKLSAQLDTNPDQLCRVPNPSIIDSAQILLPHGTTTTRIAQAEPEYDNRWLALRQGHTYHYLPDYLSVHEQTEGTVLAVAVVTPNSDALTKQNKRFDWEVSHSLDSSSASQTDRLNESAPPPAVPCPAPPELLRSWLRDLQSMNPALDTATLVIRAPIDTQSVEQFEQLKRNTA